MKKNYTLKTIIAFFAIALNFTIANAQTTNLDVVITAGVPTVFDDDGAGGVLTYQSYPADQVITMTGTATVDGVGTFDVSFDVTPAAGQRVVRSAIVWGASPEFEDVDGVQTASSQSATFRSNRSPLVTIGNITFSNYTGGLSASNITAQTFSMITIENANNRFDRFTYKIGDTEYNAPKQADPSVTLNLLTYGPVDLAGGTALTSLDEFVIKSQLDRLVNSDAWSIGSITVNVDVDYTKLSTENINKNDKTFSIFPTVTDGAFYVNKEFASLQLIDLTGKTVKIFNSSDALEVSGLAKGLYIVKLTSDIGAISTSKMIVK